MCVCLCVHVCVWGDWSTWKDLMKVHSRLRTPSARFSSLINLMTRNRRKKALEIRALSSGSCGPAAPEVSLGAAAQRDQGQAGWEGRCVSRAGEGAALLLGPY